MTRTALFSRCVNRAYIRTPQSADYAYDLAGAHLTVYFQDSDGLTDWLRNLDFPAAAYRREGETVWYAHRGFLRVWDTLLPRLEPVIADTRVKRVTVAGYSHGAALAVFCHEHVWRSRPDLRGSLAGYGFGCPRVVWGALPKGISDAWQGFTVVRNLNDIVTRLPPAALGYRHVGRLLEIGEKGKYSPIDAHRAENIRRELSAYEREKASARGHAEGKMKDSREKIAKSP